MSVMAVIWSGVSSNSKASSNSRCQLPSGEKANPCGGFAFGVESEELVGHVLEGFADASLAGGPGGAAKPVERRMDAFDDAIALDEVHALEGNVEAGVFGIAQEHEFAAAAFGFDEAEAFELADAVIDVNDVIAGLEFREIAEETRGANFAAGTLDSGRDVEEVGIAVKSDLGVGKSDASGKRSADENEGGGFGGVFRGETGGGFFGFAENVGDFVFAADIGEALKFAEAGGGEIDGATVGELRLDIGEAGDDIAVKARGGTRSEFKARTAVADRG